MTRSRGICEVSDVHFLVDRRTDLLRRAETTITPEIFASHLCADLRLPFNAFYKEIVAQIKRHIEDAQLIENYTAHYGVDLTAVREENRKWFETRAAKRQKLQTFGEDRLMVEDEGKEEALTLKEFPRQQGINDELRVMIKVSCVEQSSPRRANPLHPTARHHARLSPARRSLRMGYQRSFKFA